MTRSGGTEYSITIPATVTYGGVTYSVRSIGDEAFRDCEGFTTITLPASLTSIGNRFFLRCSSLIDVYCHAVTVPSTSTDAFHSSNIGQGTLHVPASAIGSYQSTAPWSEFATIVALTGEEMGVEQFTIDNAQMTIYDLRGRRVDNPVMGVIYIINGRKVVVKTGM